MAGFWLVDPATGGATVLPLVVASSSFVYVALADLIPQLQKRLTLPQTVAQVSWLVVGMAWSRWSVRSGTVTEPGALSAVARAGATMRQKVSSSISPAATLAW